MAFPVGWRRRAAITIAASQVSGTGSLTDFPVFLDGTVLDDTGIFSATDGAQPDAGDIRFSSDAAGATQLPCDIAFFDKTNSSAGIWVKATVDGTTDTTIYVWWIGALATGTETRPDRDSTYGGEAVWSDYEAMYALFGDAPTMDRTAQMRHLYYGDIPRTTRSYITAKDATTKYAAFPTIIKLANGTLLLTFRDNADIHAADVDGYVSVYSSTDAGRSWSALSTIGASDSTRDYRDPSLYQDDDASRTVYLILTQVDPAGSAGSDRYNYYYRSTDNGATWDSGTQLTTTNGQNRTKPLRLESGLIAVPWYEVNSSSQHRPMLTTIDPADQAKTDYTVNATFNTYNEWTLTEDTSTSPNTVRGYFRSATADGVYTSTATVDALGTWGTFTSLITTSAREPPEAQRISTGDILLLFTLEDSATSANVQIRRSTDNGATFPIGDLGYLVVEYEPIASGTGYYPSFCEINNGLYAWAIFADSSGQVYPTKIITGHFELDADGKLTGWANAGAVPVQSTNAGGMEINSSATYGLRQIDATNPLNYPHQYTTFTLGALAKLDNYTAAGLQCITGTNASAASANKGFFWGFEGTSDIIRLNRLLSGGTSNIYDSDANAIADNNYHVFHTSLDAGNSTTYVDGTSKNGTDSLTGTTTGNATYGLAIGCYNYSTRGGLWDGKIGWFYCRKSAISADWAATESNNWADPDAFATGSAAQNPMGIRHSLLLGIG